MSQQHQELRNEAAQAFEESLHDLETQLMATEDQDQVCISNKAKQPLPLKTAHRLPFHLSASTSLCQNEFDLDSLQDAATDIEEFIRGRRCNDHRLA
ncbi:MAG: hypothetical protein VKJ64_01055 [Leptolyngbyaceae bacterium]|nr:hypothetical protein [Leptolyngbyaceae bacterium]